MQRGCFRVALAYIDEFNEGTHWRFAVFCRGRRVACKHGWFRLCSRHGCHYSSIAAGVDRGTGSSPQATAKVEYPEQPGVVSPEFDEIKPGLASQRDETVWRVLVRMLGQDFFTGAEAKLSIAYVNCLIGRADQIHLDATCFRVVNRAVSPLIYIEICAAFAIQ